MFIFEFIALWVGLYLCAGVHEMGHCVVGWLHGGRTIRFQVGGGKLLTWKRGQCVLAIGSHPFAGACVQQFPAAARSWDYARCALWVAIGGPLASLAVCCALALCVALGFQLALTVLLLAIQVGMLWQSMKRLPAGRYNDGSKVQECLALLRRPCRYRSLGA